MEGSAGSLFSRWISDLKLAQKVSPQSAALVGEDGNDEG